MKHRAHPLFVIVVAIALYALFGPAAEARPDDDAAKSLEALQAQVEVLRNALGKQAAAHAALQDKVAKLEKALPGDSVRVRELAVQNAAGKTVLRMGADKTGGGRLEVFAKTGKRVALLFARSDNDGEIALYDEEARLRANLGGNDTGGYANFYGETGEQAAYIGSDTGKPYGYVAVYGGNEEALVGLYGNAKGGVVSCRNRETKKEIVMIGAEPKTGTGLVGLGTTAGKPALLQFVTKNGGQIKVLNADNKEAAFLGASASPAGNGLFYVSKKDGGRVFETGSTAGGGGYLSLRNRLNKRVLFAGAASGTAPDDGVLEVSRKDGKLGVVLRGYAGGSSVRVYDANGNVKNILR
ncbi:MAG: hypothetical protein QNJ90_06880 [Planctomycetota bacterium]|nr:hypothetical protein [Planctomycetota bacterium]